MQFYLSQKFIPSRHILKLRRLYDGNKEYVGSIEGAFLYWESDEHFDERLAEQVKRRFDL